MGRTPIRAKLVLDAEAKAKLESIAKSRTEGQARIERANVLLAYHAGERVTALAEAFHTNRPKIERILNRALEMGALASLEDRPGRGRKPEITPEARAWLMAVACTKPVDLGYPEEFWATRTLALHARKHGPEAGHPSLAMLGRGTVSKLLTGAELRPHKIEYYLERRDPEFDTKMAQILMVYREVQVLQEKVQAGEKAETNEGQLMAVLSLDEKPGIQAIGKVAPDLPPVQGKYASNGRDYEYKRHGTLSLLAGLDLLTGKVHACIEERHRSLEFTKLLEQIHQAYSAETRILIVLSLDSLVCAAGTGGQPFSPHLEGNPGLPQDAAQPFRIRVHSQARVLAESGGSLFRQDDQDHPSGNTGCIEGRVEGPNHALSPGSQRRPGRIQVALQARRRVGVIRLSCFFFFYLLHPRSSPSSPSNNRWGKRNASYWRSSTFKSKSPLPVHGLMLKRRTWIFALPKLTNRQVASLVPRM